MSTDLLSIDSWKGKFIGNTLDKFLPVYDQGLHIAAGSNEIMIQFGQHSYLGAVIDTEFYRPQEQSLDDFAFQVVLPQIVQIHPMGLVSADYDIVSKRAVEIFKGEEITNLIYEKLDNFSKVSVMFGRYEASAFFKADYSPIALGLVGKALA